MFRGAYISLCSSWYHNAVVLVNLLRSNSTRVGGYLGLQYGHICLKDLVFAKFLYVHPGRISGAAVRTYQLERSCVCQISDPERNYHCFYLLCAAPPEVLTFCFWNVPMFSNHVLSICHTAYACIYKLESLSLLIYRTKRSISWEALNHSIT